MKYKNLLVKLSGAALVVVMAVSCKGKRNHECHGCYHPCIPATEYPVYNTGDGNIYVGGDATIYQTEVRNTTTVTNSGSGNVNVGNSTNVNSSNSGSQTVTQEPAPRTQPRPQPKPKEEDKPVVEDDTVTCSTHIHISVRGSATVTRTDNGTQVYQHQTTYGQGR